MNTIAYHSTGFTIRAITTLFKTHIRVHNQESVPDGALIFVANHFTRIETFFLTEIVYQVTGKRAVWSLADAKLFDSALGKFLDAMGAVSTQNPDRDRLMVKSLLTGEASWIIYPEGRMVKDKKTVQNGRLRVAYAGGMHAPHTGAATLALRTEFYRRRLRRLVSTAPEEARRLLDRFEINDFSTVRDCGTFIIPVNITYYPIRAKENLIHYLAGRFVEQLPDRVEEEIMTESTMLLSGVDIDIRFGAPIAITEQIERTPVSKDIASPQSFDFDDPIPSRGDLRHQAIKLMEQYMTAIYRMTTVNPDHLFAAMLRKMPRKHMTCGDLRRRVYALAGKGLQADGIYLHPALRHDPLDLITDDRFGRFADFIGLAEETGVVTRDGERLEKKRSKLSPRFAGNLKDWHRARVENPVAVIANEVEPLHALQTQVRRTALLPAWWVRRRIAARLIQREAREFEQDYARFRIPGESKERAVGRPFLLKGHRRKNGILLIHGYLSAPLEVRALADYLNARGWWVYACRVKGHGTSPEDLARCSHQDWIGSVTRGYAIVANTCRRVVVGGFSNGAALALEAAARMATVSGVFAICPPLKLQNYRARFAPALDMWNRIMAKVGGDGAIKEFVDNEPEHAHINYFRNPIAGVKELERLITLLEPKLSQIMQPALVVQSLGDPVVDEKGSRRVFERLGSRNKQYVLFDFDRHGIILGPGAAQVHRCVARFLDDLCTHDRQYVSTD